MPEEVVHERLHGSVLELELDSPPFNGLTGALLAAYTKALERARLDDGVRAVVTTSSAQTWCAGGDLTQLSQGAGSDLSDLLHDSTGETASLGLVDRQADHVGAGRYVLTIDAFDKPMVAAIGGAVAGGGVALALLHDVRFGSENALFTVAFTRVGMGLEMGLSYLLPRYLGPQAAFDLAATSRRVEAQEALRLGLLLRLVPGDELVAAALEYAQRLARQPPLGVQIAKRLLRRSWDHGFRETLEMEWPWQVAAFRSDEARAAIDAVLRRAEGER